MPPIAPQSPPNAPLKGLSVRFPSLPRWLGLGLAIALLWLSATVPALAGINDDRYDGNIFALYAGNGSLVPPRSTLAAALKRNKPAILFFYVDDSRDCKQFSPTISQLQAYYGRAAEFLPLAVDQLQPENADDPTQPEHYYRGRVPQTVVLDRSGEVVLDETGQMLFETADDVLREVFDLLPRSESVELRRRSPNEVNAELVPES